MLLPPLAPLCLVSYLCLFPRPWRRPFLSALSHTTIAAAPFSPPPLAPSRSLSLMQAGSTPPPPPPSRQRTLSPTRMSQPTILSPFYWVRSVSTACISTTWASGMRGTHRRTTTMHCVALSARRRSSRIRPPSSTASLTTPVRQTSRTRKAARSTRGILRMDHGGRMRRAPSLTAARYANTLCKHTVNPYNHAKRLCVTQDTNYTEKQQDRQHKQRTQDGSTTSMLHTQATDTKYKKNEERGRRRLVRRARSRRRADTC